MGECSFKVRGLSFAVRGHSEWITNVCGGWRASGKWRIDAEKERDWGREELVGQMETVRNPVEGLERSRLHGWWACGFLGVSYILMGYILNGARHRGMGGCVS